MMKKKRLISVFVLLALVLTANEVRGQEEKKILSLEDYPRWSRIVSTDISADGIWITYGYRPNDGDDTLFIKNVESGNVVKEPYCSQPSFSRDSKWLSYFRTLPKEKAEKMRKSKKPVYKTAVIRNLQTGDVFELEKATNLSFSPGSDFLIIEKTGESKSHKGKDILIKNLKDNKLLNLGNVNEYAFNTQGSMLAYTVDADQMAGNGIYILRLHNYSILPLDTDSASYADLTWDDHMLREEERGTKGQTLAVLKGVKPEKKTQKNNKLILCKDLETASPKVVYYTPGENLQLPEEYVLSELGRITFSLDNKRMILSVKEQEEDVSYGKDTIPNVDVWHWNDEKIQSVQMVRSRYTSRSTWNGLLDLESGRYVQLTDDDLRNVQYDRNLSWFLGSDPKPYISDVNWGGAARDYYLVQKNTGKKSLIGKEIGRSMGLSPSGRYFLYFKDRHFHVYDMQTGNTVTITKNTPVSFYDTEEDHPYENPSYGIAGWLNGEEAVLLNHRFDLWRVPLSGAEGENVTANYGTENEIRFRVQRMSPDPYLDLKEGILLSAYGEWTKKAGFFRLEEGKKPKELLYTDHSYGRINKARAADKYMLTRQTFVDFPDYYLTDSRFKHFEKVTDANPQQAEYGWGRRILVDFENSKGDRLQATLTLPAGYEEGKKYPMLVYFYEKMSQRHHSYSMPTYDDRPHMSAYASDGYLVLMPDMKYYEGEPGWNALDCVTSSVQKVIDMGYADPDHIGLQGHSWGGYQSSFIVTQSDMFACVVTGAPVTNLTSMYNILYKNSGTNNHGIMETGQVRMGKSMYEDMENYIAQSPVQNAAGIKTPFMILHGTVDGAVDWNQGLEFYNAARRLGKHVILLSYPNENHHLANLNNQKDFQKRMKEYFDHFLKGTEAPGWMLNGIPHKDKLYNKAK